ncbi:hypothetical protein Taro_031319 [Colocasia esculenta]|uniref:Uncharacterized protein n=1 Tax=Colocasia esculenta TaxID=4460 RepID=A0A843VNM4_COLES|nr:hypothetical protein [Colocasia esculenta]
MILTRHNKTTVKAIEDAFKEFTTREDIAIVLISQYGYPIRNRPILDHNPSDTFHKPLGFRPRGTLPTQVGRRETGTRGSLSIRDHDESTPGHCIATPPEER